jgi:hypothetical protein
MTTATRFAQPIRAPAVALGLSLSLALGIALNLVLASAVFAGDPMSRDVDFRNSLSSQGSARAEATVRETVPVDARKRNDGLKKFGSPK